MAVELTDKFLADAAGWEAMKQARNLLSTDKVLSSNWSPPLLKGVVLIGGRSGRAGLVLKSYDDIENLCPCRPSREWGTICAHSVAIGLHHLRRLTRETAARTEPKRPQASSQTPQSQGKGQRIRRADSEVDGSPHLATEPASIHVIFPPNLPQAAQAGKVMVFFEASWSGGRGPLASLPRNKVFRFSAEDAALLDAIEALAGGDTPAMLRVGHQDFAALLTVLSGHKRITLGKNQEVRVLTEPWSPKLKAFLEPDGQITLSGDASESAPVMIGDSWVWRTNQFQPMIGAAHLAGLSRKPVRLSRAEVPAFLSRDWPQLEATGNVTSNFRIEDFRLEPEPPRFLLDLEGGLAQLHARIQCAYGPRLLTLGIASSHEEVWLPDPQSPTRYSMRDPAAENAALSRLKSAGFEGPNATGRWSLLGEDRVLTFLARDFASLQREWEVTLDERLERSTGKTERIQPRFEISASGVQWFDLDISYRSESGQPLDPREVQRLLRGGQSYTRLKSGRIALLDTGAVEELHQALLDCAPEQHAGKYRLPQNQAGFLSNTLSARGWRATAPTTWRERAAKQSGEAKLTCPPLGDLENVLRPYQRHGVAWLAFLRSNRFGGILADEMGLGKTLQALASVRAARNDSPESPPCMVVCPTSLVSNWAAEARRFTPELRTLILHGKGRTSKFSGIANHDLVITSYALARRDLTRYRALEFDTLVLDEAQHIKNRQTQNARAVKSIRAQHRLVLTGTPLENSVLDLWSIFDFLMPGYLGSASDFRERYEAPITRARDAGAQERLARRLRPFLLRRLKRDVAKDLPEKIEQVAYCDLTENQRALYQQFLDAGREEIFQTASEQGVAKGRFVALNALLRLRQVCCDPRLLGTANRPTQRGQPEEKAPGKTHASGKLELFGELLDEIIDGGHRVLVFSQFTSMLALLKQSLEAQDLAFCYLDGATKNRGEIVNQFQSGQAPVFLISLKAGGVGLNLTAADTVIHFDPWWNPAVEDQATDRAHRIGQSRVVTSYKLITRATVEEKILRLQTRKREMIRSALGGEAQMLEHLTWEEIQDLFGG